MARPVQYVLLIGLCVLAVTGDNKNKKKEVVKVAEASSLFERIMSAFLARSGGSTSQVLSLNLSNLLILLLLKAILFAAGSIGAAGWKGSAHGYGRRNLDDTHDNLFSDAELLLYLGYVTGTPGKYECLQNVACSRPYEAKKYAHAGQLLWRTAQLMKSVLNVDASHEHALNDLSEAAEYGNRGGSCDSKYQCPNRLT